MNLTQKELADSIQVPYQRINEIVSGKRGVTPSTALRLAKYFGMSADFWLNLQIKFDLYLAQKKEKQILGRIRQMSNPTIRSVLNNLCKRAVLETAARQPVFK
jgi:addiction module HigA family antidote